MKASLILLWVGLLCCPAGAASDTHAQAILFIDSGDPAQAALVTDINQALFFSPTLRQRVAVKVFDIGSASQGFTGEIEYLKDPAGKAVAHYRPGRLPYVFCLQGQQILRQYTMSHKEQLCFYPRQE